MTGVIGPTTPELLRAAHDRLGLRNMPVLSESPAGGVDADIATAKIIRARKLEVIVAGTALIDCAKPAALSMESQPTSRNPGSGRLTPPSRL
jgi:hypothetical protein